jgi:hypothetical protein
MNPVKSVAAALSVAALAAGCVTTGTSTPADSDREASLLTRYTLARCLSAAYPGTAIQSDAGAAAGGYLEFGSLPAEPYEEAAALAREAASRTYTGKHGHPLHAMKCLDLLDSPELRALLDRHVR